MNKTTVIIDLSGIFHATLHGLFSKGDWTVTESGKRTIEPVKFKSAMIGSILYYKNMKTKPSECIIAVDSAPYWRRDILPFYKGTRKSGREESDIDYKSLFPILEELIDEIDEIFPWKVIRVKSLEADDVIGILAPRAASYGKVRIISTDGDLVQLQRYPNVEQYSPITKKLVKPKDNPLIDLQHKIIGGDSGDAIPNIFSDDEFFKRRADGIKEKQKSVTSKFFTEAMNTGFNPKLFCPNDETLARYERNKMLVDFTMIPVELQDKCIEQYDSQKPTAIMKLQQYFAKNRLRLLLDSIAEI
jgi:hypothetical protein